MAIRSKIRLGQLTGSIDDSGARLAQLSGDTLQSPVDAIASAVKRVHNFGEFFGALPGVFNHAEMANSGSLSLKADSAIISAGADKDVRLTHVPDKGFLLTENGSGGGNVELQFRDNTEKIATPANGRLALFADTSVEIESPAFKALDDNVTLELGTTDPFTAQHQPNALRIAGTDAIEFNAGTEYIKSDAANDLQISANTEVDLAIGGTDKLHVEANLVESFCADLRIPDGGTISVPSQAGAITILASGDVELTDDLKVGGGDIKSPSNDIAITLDKANVTVQGDLTVKGTTTTVDTDNLTVEDRLIGLGFQSGSKGGPAGNAGIVFSRGGANNGTHDAIYLDNASSTFRFQQGTNSPLSSSLTTTGYRNVEMQDLQLSGSGAGLGGKVNVLVGSVSREAFRLVVADELDVTPDVAIANHLDLLDGTADGGKIFLGAARDSSIFHDGTGTDNVTIETTGASQFLDVKIAGNDRLTVTGDGIQVQGASHGRISNVGAQKLFISASHGAGRDVEILGGDDLYFADSFRYFSTWSDVQGIKLAGSTAVWNNFKAAYGDGTSLLDAVVQAGGGAGTLQKRVLEVTGSGFPAGHIVPIGVAGGSLPPLDFQERVDVFVNGQLLASASDVGGSGDYLLGGATGGALGGRANASGSFQFDLVADDIVTVVVR